MSVDAILGLEGAIARRLPGYEARPQQLEMANAIAAHMAEKRHLIVEAGTGVGKSFAYLIPAIQRAHESGKKVCISTNTIALQEQLIRKDVPFLQSVMPQEFTAVIAKGRGNYICHRRLDRAMARGTSLFEESWKQRELRRIQQWATVTADGTLSDFEEQPGPEIWSEVNAEAGNCLGKRCGFYSRCHWQESRRRLHNANLVIVNHHLLVSDLAIQSEGGNLLPPYDVLIVDEAHTLEGVAAEHLGLRVSQGQIGYILNRLFNPDKQTGFLMPFLNDRLLTALRQARLAANAFFDGVFAWYEQEAPPNKRMHQPGALDNPLTPALLEVYHAMADAAPGIEDEGDQLEFRNHMNRALDLAESARAVVDQTAAEHVYWVERAGRRNQLELFGCPVNVGPLLKMLLFDKLECAVLTSATLTLGRDKSFDYIRRQIGLDEAGTLALGSPFDYEKQVTCYIPPDVPDPRDAAAYEASITAHIDRFVRQTEGRAFVLFTSTALMDRVHTALKPGFETAGYRVLRQGEGLPRHRMVELFKEHGHAVLFGVDTFWQGIDVPGDSLSNVIITKLPFPVPTHPLVEARSQKIEAGGGDAFMDYSLPEAVLKLKQGFGRLIRSKEDTGIVVILDSRLLHKRYGRLIIDSLPKCTIISAPTTPGAAVTAPRRRSAGDAHA